MKVRLSAIPSNPLHVVPAHLAPVAVVYGVVFLRNIACGVNWSGGRRGKVGE